jgi:hypothetical protein
LPQAQSASLLQGPHAPLVQVPIGHWEPTVQGPHAPLMHACPTGQSIAVLHGRQMPSWQSSPGMQSPALAQAPQIPWAQPWPCAHCDGFAQGTKHEPFRQIDPAGHWDESVQGPQAPRMHVLPLGQSICESHRTQMPRLQCRPQGQKLV